MQAGKNYYIAVKIWFKRNHDFGSSDNTDFGRVSVEGVHRASGGVDTYDSTLFTAAQGVTLTPNSFISASCFAATHATQGFALYLGRTTQVISVREDEMYNGDSVAALWSRINPTTTGVVASSQVQQQSTSQTQ